MWAIRKQYHTIQLIMQESGGSFRDLEPAMQALVQAVTERLVTASAAAARWAAFIACQLHTWLSTLWACTCGGTDDGLSVTASAAT